MPGLRWGGCRWGRMVAVTMVVLAVVDGQAQRGRLPVPVIEPPEAALGLRSGDEHRLPRWAQMLKYYRQLDQKSGMVEIREIGRTSLGRPQLALFVSAPQNLRELDKLGEAQRQQARGEPADRKIETAKGRVFVLITAGMDPTEVCGTLAVTSLLHRLLTERSSRITRILEEQVIILVPSLNPDGTDIVADWHEKLLNKQSGELPLGPPGLTHKYAGIANGLETGGDFDAFTQVETQLLVDKVLNPWRPQVWYDLRQSGTQVVDQLYLASSLTARQLLRDGPVEMADDLIGSPATWARQHATIFIEARTGDHSGDRVSTQSTSPALTLDRLIPSSVIERQVAGLFSLLEQLAGERARSILNTIEPNSVGLNRFGGAVGADGRQLASRRVEKGGRNQMPSAYLLPEPKVPDSISKAYQQLTNDLRQVTGSDEEQHAKTESLYNEALGEPSTSREIRYFYQTEGLDRLLAILKRGGVEVRRADQEFTINGRTWPVGTHLVRIDQPNGKFARDILDPGSDVRAGGRSLPLMLNVEVVRVDSPLSVESRPEPMALVIQERVRENGGVRVGVYRGQSPSADEGWIRWLFDQYRFGYVSLSEADLRQPGIAARFDAIILPDQSEVGLDRALGQGQDPRPAESQDLVQGEGRAALHSLRDFVESGGTLITLNRASLFAAHQFRLPVRNVIPAPPNRHIKGSMTKGSMAILRIEVDPTDPLSLGIGKESIACYENGPAFEVLDPQVARVIARYPARVSNRLVLDGSLPRQVVMAGRAALVDVKMGRGRVILFGFRPLYRGRSLATYPFIFNALMTSGRSDLQ